MVDTGATPWRSWRRSTWVLAIGTGLAVLLFVLAWQKLVSIPEPAAVIAVGWFVLVLPLYDRHSWPARDFLILTALAVVSLFLTGVWGEASHAHDYLSLPVMLAGLEAGLWFLGGATLAIIRFFIFLRDSGVGAQ